MKSSEHRGPSPIEPAMVNHADYMKFHDYIVAQVTASLGIPHRLIFTCVKPIDRHTGYTFPRIEFKKD